MKRRTLLSFLVLGPFFTHVHAQPKTAKGIKEMQDNWKSLLAPGTAVPSAAEPHANNLLLALGQLAKRLLDGLRQPPAYMSLQRLHLGNGQVRPSSVQWLRQHDNKGDGP